MQPQSYFPPRTSSAPLVPGAGAANAPGGTPVRPTYSASKLPGAAARVGGQPPQPFPQGVHHHHLHHHHVVHHHHIHHHHQQLSGVAGFAARAPAEFISRSGATPAIVPRAESAATTSAVATPPPVATGPSAAGVSPTSEVPPAEIPSAAAASTEELDEYPEDRVYDRLVMTKYRECTTDLLESVRRFGMELWGKVQDVSDRPDHMQVSRDDLFSNSASAPQSRLIRERHLHHEVRGILARVTPEKYEKLKEELLALPIRQSDETEIRLVVETFFNKAIRPEDAPYAEYYVKLISDMITSIGAGQNTGLMIRKAIVTQCQHTFQNTDNMLANPDSQKKEGMDPEEFELLRKLTKDRNTANINLLGLLFLHGLVNERVVVNVLFTLLYGKEEDRRGRSRHTPQDFEVEMFLHLLFKVGKRCTELTSRYFKQFADTMTELSKNHPSKRIQFKLQDGLEVINNNFESKQRGAGPKTLAAFEEQLTRNKDQQRESMDAQLANRHNGSALPGRLNPGGLSQQSNSLSSSKSATASSPPTKPIPSLKELQDALDAHNERGIGDAVALLKEIPDKNTRMEYCTKWMYRPMTVMRLTDIRQKIGEIFSSLVTHKVFTHEDVKQIVQAHLREVVEKGVHTDQPRYFSDWATVAKFGEDVITTDLHTYLLRLVVTDENSDIAVIHKLIRDLSGQATHSQEAREASGKRFRLLPSLLLHCPQLDRRGDDEEYDPEEDVLSGLEDPEVFFYSSLFNDETPAELQQFVNRSPDRAEISLSVKIVCAIFCYARFDPVGVCVQRGLRDVLRKLQSFTNQKNPIELAWLAEITATYHELDRVPSDGYSNFIRWLMESSLISSASLTTFINDLSKLGKEAEADAQLLKSLVSVAPSK